MPVILPSGKVVLRKLPVLPTYSIKLVLTFAGILADLRVDLAKRHLTDEDLAISQIAWLLGYQEVSAFAHAFKRRTGKTPREARLSSPQPIG
jgi:AraC-like DNA-binding protein